MIEFHVDDYGLFENQCKRIINCIDNGIINGISIMPNSPNLNVGMDMLRRSPKGSRVNLTVHLNIVNGVCVSLPSDVNFLVDELGVFKPSYVKLLLVSYVPGLRKKYYEQLKLEISNQLQIVSKYFIDSDYRINSHVHYHMIPVVFDALMSVISEEKIGVSYIRIPKEKLSFYFKTHQRIKMVNLVKVILLNALAIRAQIKYKKQLEKYDKRVFLGVAKSGEMSYESVRKLLPLAREYAAKKAIDLEILFHVGRIFIKEEIDMITNVEDKIFMSSPNRDVEAEATLKLKDL